jgi:hypothetical protein
VGVFAVAIGTWLPWIRPNPDHGGFITGALYPASISGTRTIGVVLVYGAIFLGALGTVESRIRSRSARILGALAIGISLWYGLRFPPIGIERGRVVTVGVYLIATGGVLLLGSSARR